jgi:hypothetical protein
MSPGYQMLVAEPLAAYAISLAIADFLSYVDEKLHPYIIAAEAIIEFSEDLGYAKKRWRVGTPTDKQDRAIRQLMIMMAVAKDHVDNS